MQLCWSIDPKERPPFSEIVQVLEEIRDSSFMGTQQDEFVTLQNGWREEIEEMFVELKEKEQEIRNREEEMSKLAEEQKKHEDELNRREVAIHNKEMELFEKELLYMIQEQGTKPVPSKRKGKLNQKRLNKIKHSKAISSPSDFRHHITVKHEQLPGSFTLNNAEKNRQRAPSSPETPPASPHSGTHRLRAIAVSSDNSKMGTWGPSTAKHPSRNTAANVFHAGTWSKSTTSIDKDSIRTASSTNTIVAEPADDMDNADASDANSTSDTIADLITGAAEDQQHFDSLVSDSTLTSPVGADAHLESLPISSPEAYDRQLSGEAEASTEGKNRYLPTPKIEQKLGGGSLRRAMLKQKTTKALTKMAMMLASVGSGFDVGIANTTAIHPKFNSASDEHSKRQPQRRDAHLAAVRDGILPSQYHEGAEGELYDASNTAGRTYNTFSGMHVKHRPPLPNTDLLNNHLNGSMDFDYYAPPKDHPPLPHRRANSVEPTHSTHTNTIERMRRDNSKDRRRRNISGERQKRGASVDRNAAYDSHFDRRRDKSTDRTRSEINLHRRRDLSGRDPSVDRIIPDSTTTSTIGLLARREQSVDRANVSNINTSSEQHSDSDSDAEGGNYVKLIEPLPPVGRQASRQTSSESNCSVFERNVTPRNSSTSKGRSSFTTSPGYAMINYKDASPHYSPSSMHHHGSQQLYGQHQTHHHTSPQPIRNHSPMNLSSSSSTEANDYVNVNWKNDDIPDEPPPRPPRPNRLDIKNPPNCGVVGPPKTQPRISRSQAGTPQSSEDLLRSKFSPGGSPPPPNHQQKTLLPIDVDDKKVAVDIRKPTLPPKPCPGTHHTVTTPNSKYV
ncbi:hypothetical protein EB796_023377 [Bugula neritina]|uniref:Uncharacterized protein n=1 Tax=Bugula neritina TaxID=10212 RepID=A0A7J7IY01_BUGNE|nr:hypothetical protein EB796_023377 [Bugula neritina]